MPFDKTVLANLGSTQPHKGEFRAHLQLRNEEGTKINIYGPCRTTEEEGQKDLCQIRAAGGVGSTREESQPASSQQPATGQQNMELLT